MTFSIMTLGLKATLITICWVSVVMLVFLIVVLMYCLMSMDKLHLTGQNLGRVFNSRSGRVHAIHSCCYWARLPDLKLKTWPKQLLGSLPLDIALPASAYGSSLRKIKKKMTFHFMENISSKSFDAFPHFRRFSVLCNKTFHPHPSLIFTSKVFRIIRGQFVEQKVMLSCSFRCDQIYCTQYFEFCHSLLCCLSQT